MKDFLSEYLITLSGKRNTHISELLSAASVSKNDLDSIADKLRDSKKDSPISISKEGFGSLISRNNFDAANRDAGRRILDLFQVSNRISLLLDSHTAILSSEIKTIEDEILAMEKAIANYAFTLSDSGFYDYAFIETFNDDTFREDIDLKLTDRSGVDFSKEEKALVNSAAGILSLNPALSTSYPLSGSIINNNCLSLATSNTGIDNALNTEASNGWRVAVSSPKPFTSKIDNSLTKQGAQVELEVFLSAPSPCDTILLNPFSDVPLDLMRIKIFSDNNDQSTVKTVFDDIQILDKPFIVNFPLQSVSKIRITLNQSVYSRGELPSTKTESIYRDFYTDIKTQRDSVTLFVGQPFDKNDEALKRIFVRSQSKEKDLRIFRSEIPKINFEPQFGPLTIDKIVNHSDKRMTTYTSKASTFMRKMINEKVFANNTEILNQRSIFNANTTFLSANNSYQMTMMSGYLSNQEILRQPQLSVDILSYSTLQEQQFLDYQYSLGLRNIQVGFGERIYRGVFISKQIPAPSDSGEVKIKVDQSNFELLDTARDSGVITSTEYSISNKSNPSSELDWTAILPIGETFVNAERLFLDELGKATLRFPASTNGSFQVFKNGIKIDLDSVTEFTSTDKSSIKSIQIDPRSFSSNDIFTINYEPYGDQSILNFEQRGLDQKLLASAFDDNGAGETFYGTYNNQIITLNNDPYINYDSIFKYGSYSTTLGFNSTYQPITIIMNDGTVALNQTNYNGGTQNSLSSFDETKTVYIHSGKNIAFNKPITEKFTVFYQYLPSNIRFRVIMRVNDINYVSPTVNSVQIKTKTRKADPRKLI
jgi:hypothetical protein